MSSRKWNRGRNGLHQLGQPVAPSILFPGRHFISPVCIVLDNLRSYPLHLSQNLEDICTPTASKQPQRLKASEFKTYLILYHTNVPYISKGLPQNTTPPVRQMFFKYQSIMKPPRQLPPAIMGVSLQKVAGL